VFFFTFNIIKAGQFGSWQIIMETLSAPHVWLAMFAAAGIGWGIYFIIPPLVSQVVIINTEADIVNMEKRMNRLVEEWGEEVRGGTPPAPTQFADGN
jgi:hypothetical protein